MYAPLRTWFLCGQFNKTPGFNSLALSGFLRYSPEFLIGILSFACETFCIAPTLISDSAPGLPAVQPFAKR